MQRISTEPNGVFKNGVPGVSRGTRCDAAWHNAVQEEIAGLIERSGGTLDPNDDNQLYGLFRETLDRIFKGPVSVQNPNAPGVETTIEAGVINLFGIILSCHELDGGARYLSIDKLVKILDSLNVDGDIDAAGTIAAAVLRITGNASFGSVRSESGAEVNGNLWVRGESNMNSLAAQSATFKSALSAVDFVQEYSGNSGIDIDDAMFPSTRRRLRVVVQTGTNRLDPSQVVNITAAPSDGLCVHVVNMATASDGFVFVRSAGTNLCVLSPGCDRWFSANGNSWIMDRYLVG